MKRKAFKVRTVDMCIYIDQHIYEENHDVELIFEYLQDLFYSLAIKQKYFNSEENYEQYSLYCATQAYLRLTNKRQFLPDDDPRKLKKVKSILNWIKRVMYGFKVNYQKENFNLIHKEEYQGEGINESIQNNMESTIRQNSFDTLSIEIKCYFDKLPSIIKNFLKTTPYSKDKLITHNLYMSCLITLLRCITLSNYNKIRLFNNINRPYKDNLLNIIYNEENLNAPVVWNLPSEFTSYITVLTNKIKDIIVKDIRDLITYNEPTQEIIKDILMTPYDEFGDEINE